jgi:hypothetical protein
MRPPRDPRPFAIPLTDRQRAILEDMGHSRRRPHDDVQRATSSLQSADGARTRHFVEALRVSGPTVRLWRLRRWRPTKRPCAAFCSRSYASRPAVDTRPHVPRSSSARSSPLPVRSPRPPPGR